MPGIKFAPSLKKGNGVRQDASSATSSVPGAAPMASVAARLGFKRGGAPLKPEFDFQTPLLNPDAMALARRRTQMKHTAAQVYNEMGLSVRSHEVARAALLWFNQLKEILTEEERDQADRISRRLGDIVEDLLQLREAKIEKAKHLETALTAAKRDLRTSKVKKAIEEDSLEAQTETGKRKRVNTYTPEEDHPETAMPSIALDPALVLNDAAEEIKLKEAGKPAKKARKKRVKKPGQDGTS